MKKSLLKRILSGAFAVLLLCAVLSMAGCSAWGGTYKAAKEGVVRVCTEIGTGSGFGIGKVGHETQYFITNRHVIYDEDNGKICDTVFIPLTDDAAIARYDANGYFMGWDYTNSKDVVVCDVLYPTAVDPAYPDFAILKARQIVPGRIALPLQDSFTAADGDIVYAIGYPGTADDVTALTSEGGLKQEPDGTYVYPYPSSIEKSTMTNGIVERIIEWEMAEGTHVIQHNAHINHGNSGGPLVTEKGVVIGINTYGYGGASDMSEYGFSVFTNYVMEELDQLRIHYDTADDVSNNLLLWILIGVAVLACGAVAAALIIRSSRSKAPAGGPAKGPGQATNAGYMDNSVRSLRLQGVSGFFAGRRFPVENGVRLGRNAGNDLVYPSDTKGISGTHCRLNCIGNELWLEDCNATYGTFYLGRRLGPGERVRLNVGDSFSLGGTDNTFRIERSSRPVS